MSKATKRFLIMIVIVLISNVITATIMNKVNENKINNIVKSRIVIEEENKIEVSTADELEYLINKCTLDNTKEFIECD